MDISLRMQREIMQGRKKSWNLFQVVGLVGLTLVLLTWSLSVLVLFRKNDESDGVPNRLGKIHARLMGAGGRNQEGLEEINEKNENFLVEAEAGADKKVDANANGVDANGQGVGGNVTDFSPLPGMMHGMLRPMMEQVGLGGERRLVPIVEDSELQKERLNRNVTDFRHHTCKNLSAKWPPSGLPAEATKLSVIIIFCNEPKWNLYRTIHSVLNRTPAGVLHEIVLVDDGSTSHYIVSEAAGSLSSYIKELPKTRLIRNPKRTGIVGARLLGIGAVTSPIFAILDSHVEVGYDWAEPLVSRIAEDPKKIVMPTIDGIDVSSGEVTRGGIGCVLGILWRMVEHSFPPNEKNPSRMNLGPADYVTSPTMAGGIFAANRDEFLRMGGYDNRITFWGVENVELSFRWWQCGGTIECTECSRVAHIFGGYRGYSPMRDASLTRNKLRVMAVWMDDFADLSWKLLSRPRTNLGDLTERQEIRKRLECKPFSWFITNVWPEADVHNVVEDVPYFGSLKNKKMGACFGGGYSRNLYSGACTSAEGLMHFRRPGRICPIGNEERCLTAPENVSDLGSSLEGRQISMDVCHERRPDFQNFAVEGTADNLQISLKTRNLCLAMLPALNKEHGDDDNSRRIILMPCDKSDPSQVWEWQAYKLEKSLPWQSAAASAEM